MSAYSVTCDALEMPRGTQFYTLPPSLAPIKRGDLCLFNLEGHSIVGRWYPGDLPWIQLPGIRVEIGPNLNWRIVGVVVAIDQETAFTCLN